jgi:very-short-patch-repair endonuclease
MSKGEDTFALHCKVHKLTPEREFRFHPTRRWKFDFAWPALKLAVEIEGGTWVAGRHSRALGFEADCLKYNCASLLGWTILRYTTRMVEAGNAIDDVLEVLGKKTPR